MMSSKLTAEYVRSLIERGKRLDGRKLDEFREIKINYGVSEKAEGSAEVMIGNTRVVAGVKMDIGEPYPDMPNKGVLVTSAEFLAMAAPEFEPGLPGENAIELARVVDRGVRESGAIDLEKLCLVEGEKVWVVFLDIFVLNHDGNLIDAAGIAAIAALLNAKLPKITEDYEIVRDELTDPLPIKDIPIPITIRKYGEHLLLDTTALEEDVLTGKFTVTTKINGNICAMQLSDGMSMTKDEVLQAARMARDAATKIREKLFKDKLKELKKA